MQSVYDAAEKQAEAGAGTRASWTGALALNLPALGLDGAELTTVLSFSK